MDLNAKNEDGETFLLWFCGKNSVDPKDTATLVKLLKAGAEPMVQVYEKLEEKMKGDEAFKTFLYEPLVAFKPRPPSPPKKEEKEEK